MKKTVLLAMALLALLTGCMPRKKEKPVSKEEAMAFARQIESGIQKKDGTFLDQAIDADLLADAIVQKTDGKNKASIRAGIKQAWKKRSLSQEILGSIRSEGSYQFVRQYDTLGHSM